MAKIVLTCGPASSPIDSVRRITNHSTGALGSSLLSAWAACGHEVIVFRGSGSTVPLPEGAAEVIPFATNDDLASALSIMPNKESINAVFHAAALSDYQVGRVESEVGSSLTTQKIASHHSHLTIRLVPAPKVLPQLRGWFPNSKIVSWKYELEGSRDAAVDRARQHCVKGYSDLSIVNGAAFGAGFGICSLEAECVPVASAYELSLVLENYLRS